MSFSTVWHDYNIQRTRRYDLVPKLLAVARPFLHDTKEKEISRLVETAERAKKMQEFGFALIGEQFEEEKNLGKELRSFLTNCHHHHALLLKNSYRDIENDLLDAEAHIHAHQGLIIGHHRKKERL